MEQMINNITDADVLPSASHDHKEGLFSQIKIENSDVFWDKNQNSESWTLCKPFFQIGKRWGDDRIGENVYGWVELVTYGKYEGKYNGGHPICYDDEIESDAVDLGYFNSRDEAMSAVLISNNPDYSGVHC